MRLPSVPGRRDKAKTAPCRPAARIWQGICLNRPARGTKMKDYIPELSEIRMVRRAPEHPLELNAEDASYIANCLRSVESAFQIDAFPGQSLLTIPARALIKTFIDWWRGLEPANEAQREALAKLPSAIRLIDTISTWLEEQTRR
jgi:hypothetical protein